MRIGVEEPKSSAILFSKSSNFQLGNKDLKRRTGSWRVLQILATINLAFWIGVAILFWLGTINPTWNNLSFAFLVLFFYSVFQLVYLNFYICPRKRVPHNRDDSEMNRTVPANPFCLGLTTEIIGARFWLSDNLSKGMDVFDDSQPYVLIAVVGVL